MIQIHELFKKNIKFIQYGRSGSILIIKNKYDAMFLKSHGWNLYESYGYYRLNPPCVNLSDISDIEKINQYFNPAFNYAMHIFLKKKAAKNKLNDYIDSVVKKNKIHLKNFCYHISNGPILDFAIKIEGSDERIKKLHYMIVTTILNDEEFIELYKKALSKRINNELTVKCEIKEVNRDIFNRLCLQYGSNKQIKKGEQIYFVHKNNINFDSYDYVLFILNGCFKFLKYFDLELLEKKLLFWEIHIDKTKGADKICNIDLLKNKKVLLVDSLYSGSTINYIKNILFQVTKNVDVLGVFPKSTGVIKLCDYVMIGNEIFDCKYLKKSKILCDYLNFFGGNDEKGYTG